MPLGEHQSTLYISLISGDLGLRSHLPRQSQTPIFVSLAVWGCWKLWWILCLLVSTFCPLLSFSFYDPNWQIPWMWPENIVHVSRSVVPDSATPWRVAHQAPPPMGLSRQEYWSGVPLLSPKISDKNSQWGQIQIKEKHRNCSKIQSPLYQNDQVHIVSWGILQTFKSS